ncbi:uncharacterized protein [Diabrotica undecimpunctata]|uniref:uncharacterized protein n=1 Tax=Diabrotica undecimpunctata TaxID=50387 RepID=UPI003B63396E
MKLTFHKKTYKTKNILRRASFALIREAIHDTRRDIDKVNSELLELHLVLSNSLHPILWNTLETLSNFRAETNADLTKIKQLKKFNSLTAEQRPRKKETPPTETHKLVYNFSNLELNEATTSVLSKGFNFAVAPARIPVENIISEVESSITNIPPETAEIIRQDVSQILRTAKPPKRNLTREEKEALRDLQKNKEIIVLPADKGNATVVMNIDDYDKKLTDLLNDTAYEKIATDPTTYLEKTTKAKIKVSNIKKEDQPKLIPREKSSRCPKLYGLPKVHKVGMPLRPIVSSIGSPTQPLAKFLANQLQPYAEEADSYVKNAGHFIERIKDVTLDPGHLLVSFDVVSLFTNVPVEESLEIIGKKYPIPPDTLNLTRHCLNNTYFIYKDQRYKQVEGAPMGSPLSPVIANLFMQEIEIRAITTAEYKPKLWLRYVDDTFIIWTHGEEKLNTFLNHINTIHPKIQFTMELEKDQQLPFLDVLIIKKTDGTLGYTEKLLPNLPEKIVVVMDNALYHMRREEVIPTQAFNKDQIKIWLLEKDIFFEEDYLKSELMEVVNTYKERLM